MEQEIWKDIEGYEGLYQVSNLGNVRGLDRIVKRGNGNYRVKGRILPIHTNEYRNKTLHVSLYRENKLCTAKIHRLVATAFIPNPFGFESVRHKDGNRENNSVENLEWYSCTKHGLNNTRLHRIWSCMKTRCSNRNRKDAINYVNRGVSVCDEWKNDFKAFYDWAMQNGYSENLTIDRINVNGNYEPSNCRWATPIEQANNTRRNKYYLFNGERFSLKQLSELCGVNQSTIYNRIKNGISVEDAIMACPQFIKTSRKAYAYKVSKKYLFNGEMRPLSEWSEILGIGLSTLKSRVQRGLVGDALFNKSKIKKNGNCEMR